MDGASKLCFIYRPYPISLCRRYLDGRVEHDVSPTTTLNNSVTFDWFSEDNPAQSQRLFWKIMTGVDSKLSPRLTFFGHVGGLLSTPIKLGTLASPTIPVGLVGASSHLCLRLERPIAFWRI